MDTGGTLVRKWFLASAAISAMVFAGSASGADLPAAMPVYKAPPMPSAFNWSGFYLGVEGGGAWGRSQQSSGGPALTNTFNTDGGLIGGTYGTNWQFGSWVLGLESDASWVDLRGTTSELVNPGFTAETRQLYLGTNRGRVGYATDHWLIYGTGGFADTLIEASSTGPLGSVSQTKYRLGWTAGGGVEWAFAPKWSAKIEYLYTDFGSSTAYLNPVPAGFVGRGGGVSFNENIVRVGINYQYDLPGALLGAMLGRH
jgi:outer membrane immunogenic protein